MKRNTLIAVALCLMMISTAGAGAKSAKHDENPRRAGKSNIHFFDVEATHEYGYGRLVINTDKHTFVFIGQDFRPSQHVYLQFKTDEGFDAFASGRSTPSGNLHIAGTWEPDDPPIEVVAAVYSWGPAANGFSLTNDGWFMVKLAVDWTTDYYYDQDTIWHTITATDSFGLNKSRRVNLDDLGVPYGAWVAIRAIVVGGKDRAGTEVFSYANGPCYIPGYCYPDYTIRNVTWNPILEYWRTDCYCSPLD
jgi:hypothetical protein